MGRMIGIREILSILGILFFLVLVPIAIIVATVIWIRRPNRR